jgi:hypothetical protein
MADDRVFAGAAEKGGESVDNYFGGRRKADLPAVRFN